MLEWTKNLYTVAVCVCFIDYLYLHTIHVFLLNIRHENDIAMLELHQTLDNIICIRFPFIAYYTHDNLC